MENNRKINFSIGIFDQISENIKIKIKKESENCELYGIGLYTDEFIIKKYKTYPVKTIQERMQLAKQLEGVDFVFSVDTTNKEELKKIVKQEYIKILKNS